MPYKNILLVLFFFNSFNHVLQTNQKLILLSFEDIFFTKMRFLSVVITKGKGVKSEIIQPIILHIRVQYFLQVQKYKLYRKCIMMNQMTLVSSGECFRVNAFSMIFKPLKVLQFARMAYIDLKGRVVKELVRKKD